MELQKAIESRKSVRKYSLEKPDWKKIIQAINSSRFAPMAGNLFTPRFILVDEKEKIEKIKDACQQEFIKDASYLVVVVSDSSRINKMYSDFAEKFARQQAGAAIQNFWLSLVSLGLVTCWVGYFEESQIKRTLKIPENLVIEAIFPIGKESKLKTTQPRKTDLDNLVYFNSYGTKFMKPRKLVSLEAI